MKKETVKWIIAFLVLAAILVAADFILGISHR
jgi:hypothetical protein